MIAGVEHGAALTDDDAAGVHKRVAENLYTKALSLRITTVAGRAAALLMCHFCFFLNTCFKN